MSERWIIARALLAVALFGVAYLCAVGADAQEASAVGVYFFVVGLFALLGAFGLLIDLVIGQ